MAVRQLGLPSPVDSRVRWQFWQRWPGRIVGVVKDFHFQSLHDRIEPVAMYMGYEPDHVSNFTTVRISAEDVQGSLAYLEQTWQALRPDQSFDYFIHWISIICAEVGRHPEL